MSNYSFADGSARFYKYDASEYPVNLWCISDASIVKSICTAYGGKVGVESIEGAGSRFSVEPPLAISKKSNADRETDGY